MKVPLWILRKIVYVATGSALGAGLAYVTNHPEINSWTLGGATGAIGAALVGDLRRAFFPNLFDPKT